MKSLLTCLCLLVLINPSTAQEKSKTKNRFIIHTYPSALVVGDMAVGIEFLHRTKWSQEISSNYRLFPNHLNNFDKGFGFDYLAKYSFDLGQRWRLAPFLSLSYQNVYYKNKIIHYYFVDDSGRHSPKDPYLTLLEGEKKISYSWGIGFSCYLKLYRRFWIGTDLGLKLTREDRHHQTSEVLYQDPNVTIFGDLLDVAEYTQQRNRLRLSARLKLSCVLGKM